jgi:hypothetical protein
MALCLRNLWRQPHVKIVFKANTLQLLAWPINLVAFHVSLASIPQMWLVQMHLPANNVHRDICNLSLENQTAILCPAEPS